MPPKGSKKTGPISSKSNTVNSAKELLNQFYTEDEKGKYFDFYKQFRRRQAVIRGALKEKAENLNYGSVYQKWIDLKRGLVEIPLAQLTISCKFLDLLFLPQLSCLCHLHQSPSSHLTLISVNLLCLAPSHCPVMSCCCTTSCTNST